jgi:hypothetical protein
LELYGEYARQMIEHRITGPLSPTGTKVRDEARTVGGARVYWTSGDMLELALHAAASMPDEPLLETDPPCPVGMFFFERSIGVTASNGDWLPVRAFTWCITGMPLGSFGKDGDFQISRPQELQEGTLWSYYSDIVDFGLINPAPYPGWDGMKARLLFFGDSFEPFGEKEQSVETEAAASDATLDELLLTRVRLRRLPRALWTLSRQRLATISVRRAPRQERRAMERAGSPVHPEILIVQLRHIGHDALVGGEHAVEWTRRWMVGGHWRNQWLPSVKAHRLQWIAPYIKGPEGKPLILPRKIHELVR